MSKETAVFSARRIITMNPSRPFATHVAVREGRIVAVGSEAELANLATAGRIDDPVIQTVRRLVPLDLDHQIELPPSWVEAVQTALQPDDEVAPLRRKHETHLLRSMPALLIARCGIIAVDSQPFDVGEP